MTRRNPYGVDGKPLEWVIQDAILDYLWLQSRANPCKFWRSRPSQYIRAQGSNVGFELHYTEVGQPDVMGVAWGWFVGLEVKRPGHVKLRDPQVRWRDDLLRVPGTRFYIVTSIDDVERALAECRGEFNQRESHA